MTRMLLDLQGLAFALTLSLVGCAGWVEADRVRMVSPEQALVLAQDERTFLLDVRPRELFELERIEGAYSIPLGELWSRLHELPEDRDRPLLVYCRTGRTSARAAWLLKEEGWSRVYDMRGGLIAWKSAGLPLVRGPAVTGLRAARAQLASAPRR